MITLAIDCQEQGVKNNGFCSGNDNNNLHWLEYAIGKPLLALIDAFSLNIAALSRCHFFSIFCGLFEPVYLEQATTDYKLVVLH